MFIAYREQLGCSESWFVFVRHQPGEEELLLRLRISSNGHHRLCLDHCLAIIYALVWLNAQLVDDQAWQILRVRK